jgi:uncharacterized protein YodC (DUF2158 family)
MFKIGDRVRVKGNSLEMSVERYDAEQRRVLCYWPRQGQSQRDEFPEEMLERVQRKPGIAMSNSRVPFGNKGGSI